MEKAEGDGRERDPSDRNEHPPKKKLFGQPTTERGEKELGFSHAARDGSKLRVKCPSPLKSPHERPRTGDHSGRQRDTNQQAESHRGERRRPQPRGRSQGIISGDDRPDDAERPEHKVREKNGGTATHRRKVHLI